MGKQLTPLETLQLLVPGYRGYKAKDLIRQDDFLIRSSVKNKLEGALSKLAELEAKLVSASPFNPQLKRIEFVASKIRTLISELMAAQGGGADVYARYKIATEQLDEIVRNDLAMIQMADNAYQMAAAGNVDQVEAALESIRQVLMQRQSLFFPPEYR